MALRITRRQWSSRAVAGFAPGPIRVTNTKCITFESLYIAFYIKSNETYEKVSNIRGLINSSRIVSGKVKM